MEGTFGLDPDYDFLILLSGAYSLVTWADEVSIWSVNAEMPPFVDYVDQDFQAIIYRQMTAASRVNFLDPSAVRRIVNCLEQAVNNRFR